MDVQTDPVTGYRIFRNHQAAISRHILTGVSGAAIILHVDRIHNGAAVSGTDRLQVVYMRAERAAIVIVVFVRVVNLNRKTGSWFFPRAFLLRFGFR